MKLIFVILFFSCSIQAFLLPIYNDDYYKKFTSPPIVPKSPASLHTLTMEAIARDKLNFSNETINLLPQELAQPIQEMRIFKYRCS